MTEVAFHFNVPDRLGYTCRLLRKAAASGARVGVVGEEALLERLDRQLWTFEPASFVPHLRLLPGVRVAPHLQATPIWLAERLDALADASIGAAVGVVVLLTEDVPEGLDAYPRVIEVVARQADELDAARRRWRSHAAAGRTLVRHDVGMATPAG